MDSEIYLLWVLFLGKLSSRNSFQEEIGRQVFLCFSDRRNNQQKIKAIVSLLRACLIM